MRLDELGDPVSTDALPVEATVATATGGVGVGAVGIGGGHDDQPLRRPGLRGDRVEDLAEAGRPGSSRRRAYCRPGASSAAPGRPSASSRTRSTAVTRGAAVPRGGGRGRAGVHRCTAWGGASVVVTRQGTSASRARQRVSSACDAPARTGHPRCRTARRERAHTPGTRLGPRSRCRPSSPPGSSLPSQGRTPRDPSGRRANAPARTARSRPRRSVFNMTNCTSCMAPSSTLARTRCRSHPSLGRWPRIPGESGVRVDREKDSDEITRVSLLRSQGGF